jgi:hypothetical protein
MNPAASFTSSKGTSRGKGKRTGIRVYELGEVPAQHDQSLCAPSAVVRGNRYGCSRAHAIVLAMRYVIVICAVTFFLIWDGLYNQGRYLDTTVREITRIMRYITSMV